MTKKVSFERARLDLLKKGIRKYQADSKLRERGRPNGMIRSIIDTSREQGKNAHKNLGEVASFGAHLRGHGNTRIFAIS
jgi:hypothetical protein